MMIIPSTKRIMGDDPAVERYSFVATEIMNAPSTRPMISGLAYCTTSAWCMPRAPAVSRIKQAIQNAMLAGLPNQARQAAIRPQTTPAKASFVFWDETPFSVPADTDIFVNATSVGLFPNTDQKPNVDYDTVKASMVVTDVIFNDPNSLFLQEAGDRGAKTINGLGMLANQAAMNFKLWTGTDAPVGLMMDVLRREFGLQ